MFLKLGEGFVIGQLILGIQAGFNELSMSKARGGIPLEALISSSRANAKSMKFMRLVQEISTACLLMLNSPQEEKEE